LTNDSQKSTHSLINHKRRSAADQRQRRSSSREVGSMGDSGVFCCKIELFRARRGLITSGLRRHWALIRAGDVISQIDRRQDFFHHGFSNTLLGLVPTSPCLVCSLFICVILFPILSSTFIEPAFSTSLQSSSASRTNSYLWVAAAKRLCLFGHHYMCKQFNNIKRDSLSWIVHLSTHTYTHVRYFYWRIIAVLALLHQRWNILQASPRAFLNVMTSQIQKYGDQQNQS